METMSEAETVERARSGDTRAFESLFDRHKDFVWSVAYRMIYDFDEAEDLAQDVFVTAWRRLDSFRGESRFSTWLYRITVNKTLNRIRSLKAARALSDEMAWSRLDARALRTGGRGCSLEELETERDLAWLLGRLSPQRRMAVILRELMGLSYEEISDATGWPVGTVRSRISRARAELSESAAKMEERR